MLYLFARPALTRGKRNPCETPWPSGLRDRGRLRSEHETNDERGAGSAPRRENRRAKTDIPNPYLPDLSPPYLPWPVGSEGGEPLTWGGYDNGLVFLFLHTNLLLMGFVDTGKGDNSACY